MKSDVIRKRSRHDARCVGAGVSETPSASPGASRRPTPNADGSDPRASEEVALHEQRLRHGPPSSAISYSSFGDEFSCSNTSASSSSQCNSMEFPFATYSYGIMHSVGSAFSHPPILPQDNVSSRSATYCHPPMLHSEGLVSALLQLHPPMLLSDWSNGGGGGGGNNGYKP